MGVENRPSVRLVGITSVVNDDFTKGQSPGDLIAYCARVSNPSNQNNVETAAKLLNYCIKHHHWSIFEMANLVIEINTTRDIARQILRHRSLSFQEFSQRYADPLESGLTFKYRRARLQDKKNRQNSIPIDDDDPLNRWFLEAQERVAEFAGTIYKEALEKGIAKEVARAILPEGLVMSRLYANGTVRSWIHFVQVRDHETAQLEVQEIAKEIKRILIEKFPALEQHLTEK
jgi:thymidylate synthase (FAD)